MTIKSKNPNDRRFATRRHCDPMKIAPRPGRAEC
jgi:hypothetical protein